MLLWSQEEIQDMFCMTSKNHLCNIFTDYSFNAMRNRVVIIYTSDHQSCGPSYPGAHGILFDTPLPSYANHFGAKTSVALFRESLDQLTLGKYQYLGDYQPWLALPFSSKEWEDIPLKVSHMYTATNLELTLSSLL